MDRLGKQSAHSPVNQTYNEPRKFDVANWLREIEERDPSDRYELIDGENGLEIFA